MEIVIVVIELLFMVIFFKQWWGNVVKKETENLVISTMKLFGMILIEVIVIAAFQALNNGTINYFNTSFVILVVLVSIQFILINIHILIHSGKRLVNGEYRKNTTFAKRIVYLIVNLLFVMILSHIIFGYLYVFFAVIVNPLIGKGSEFYVYFNEFYSPFYVSLAIIYSLPLSEGFNKLVNEGEIISLFVAFHTIFFKIVELVSIGYIVTLIIEELQTKNDKLYVSSKVIKEGNIKRIIDKLKESQKISAGETLELEKYIKQLLEKDGSEKGQ